MTEGPGTPHDNRDTDCARDGLISDPSALITKAMAEIQVREERFRSTFEQAAVGIAHVALDGTFLRINRRFCDIVGYSWEEMLTRTFQDLTHPDDLDADLEHMHQVLADEIKTYAMEKRYFKKDGKVVWINLTVSLLREDNGDPATSLPWWRTSPSARRQRIFWGNPKPSLISATGLSRGGRTSLFVRMRSIAYSVCPWVQNAHLKCSMRSFIPMIETM